MFAKLLSQKGMSTRGVGETANGRTGETAKLHRHFGPPVKQLASLGLAGHSPPSVPALYGYLAHSPIRPFAHSPIRPFAHSPIRPFAHSPIRPFAGAPIRRFAILPSYLQIRPRSQIAAGWIVALDPHLFQEPFALDLLTRDHLEFFH
jgi:hypothetical protein